MSRNESTGAPGATASARTHSSRLQSQAHTAQVLALSALFALSACGSKDSTQPTTQPPHDTTIPVATSGYVEARTSQIVTDGSPPTQVFDDFTLSSATTVRTVG